MLKQERARITRSNIVSSAARSFHLHGFSKTSLADIIDEAGVTKGALYFHFESKEDVARAVLDTQLEHVTRQFDALTASGLPPLEQLVRLCVHPSSEEDELPGSGFRLATEIASLQPALTLPFYEEWLRMIGTILRTAAEEGQLRQGVDADRLSTFILSAITGAELVSAVLATGEHPAQDDRDLWQHVFLQTVAEEKLGSVGALLELALAD